MKNFKTLKKKLLINYKTKSISALFLFISLLFILNNKNDISTLKINYITNKSNNNNIDIINHISNNFVKFNTYYVHMHNTSDFFKYKYFILMPGKNCPNKNLKTLFFKPKYPQTDFEYIKFQDKNITLNLVEPKDFTPIAYSKDLKKIREHFLTKMGFKLSNKLNSSNLCMTPYNINSKFKKNLFHYILNDYQKVNRFLNYEDYASKSQLYINYKNFEERFPSDYDYMLETYSFPEEKIIIEKKFKNYILKSNDDVWLIKPPLGSLGSNISMIFDSMD